MAGGSEVRETQKISNPAPVQQATIPTSNNTVAAEPEEPQPTPPGKVYNYNIHITINIPDFRCFRRRCARENAHSPQRPRTYFLAAILFILYLSFIVGGAVSWDLRNKYDFYRIPEALLVLSTFSPLIDVFAVVSAIRLINMREGKPNWRYSFVLLINFLLLLLQIIILVFAACWTSNNYYSYSWNWRCKKRAIVGLTLYSMATMILIKLFLGLKIMTNKTLFQTFKDSTRQLTCEYEYRDIDDDANNVETPRPSTEEGRIYLA
jgi:hypothetical protein